MSIEVEKGSVEAMTKEEMEKAAEELLKARLLLTYNTVHDNPLSALQTLGKAFWCLHYARCYLNDAERRMR